MGSLTVRAYFAGVLLLLLGIGAAAVWNHSAIVRQRGDDAPLDLNIRSIPMGASSHVTFSNGNHSAGYTITGASTKEVDDEIVRTRHRLAVDWGVPDADVTVRQIP